MSLAILIDNSRACLIEAASKTDSVPAPKQFVVRVHDPRNEVRRQGRSSHSRWAKAQGPHSRYSQDRERTSQEFTLKRPELNDHEPGIPQKRKRLV